MSFEGLVKKYKIKKTFLLIFVCLFLTFNFHKAGYLKFWLANIIYNKNVPINFSVNNLSINFLEENSLSLKEQLDLLNLPANLSNYEKKTIVIDNETKSLPFWQINLTKNKKIKNLKKDQKREETKNYNFLVVVLQIRLYSYDKARWSFNELVQWLHFLFLAGVEHVFICDHFFFLNEKIDQSLSKYIHLKLVSYLKWNKIRNPMASQVRCYQHILRSFKKYHYWQMAIDVDEYPFSSDDMKENFLVRFLQKVPEDVGEVSMANYLMLGKGNKSLNMVVRRINRMIKTPPNKLSKPIYRPSKVASVAVHHNFLFSGKHIEAPHEQLKLLHYWGGRDQNWGNDTPKTIEITKEMNLMREIWAPKIENSLITFGDSFALSNSTGP